MYNKRLKITEENFNKLADCFNWFFSLESVTQENQVKRYFEIAKNNKYSNTRVFWDFFHALRGYTGRYDMEKYNFLNALWSRDGQNLNDAQIESALKIILGEKFKDELKAMGEN